MSRTADIDLTFGYPVTVTGMLSTLAGHGWTAVEPMGVSYVIAINDDWDWRSEEPGRAAEIALRLDAPDLSGVPVGISLYHQQAATGGTMLFFRDRKETAFSPVLDRREVPGAPRMTDMAWYVQHLVYPLIDGGLLQYELRDLAV